MGKKKKGGNYAKNKGGGIRQKGPSRLAPGGAKNNKDIFTQMSNLPSFHETSPTSNGSGGSGGYYNIYKQATTRFCNWMKMALPETKMTAVNDLRKGAIKMFDHNVEILDHKRDPPPTIAPMDILEDLDTSIEFREKVTNSQYGGGGDSSGTYTGDEGHKHIVLVLKDCRKALWFGRAVARSLAANDKSEQQETVDTKDVVGGRFHALALTDEEEAEEERQEREQMEKDIQERNFPTFPEFPSKEDEEMDIEKVLINGDDRFQALSLLHTMDDLMQAVESHYGLLKNLMQGDDTMHQGSSVIQLLMQCAVAANMATQTIHSAENALYASHPSISSFYHVLAVVFLPSPIADVQKLWSPDRMQEQQQEPHSVALEFVAQIVECCFHNRGDTRIAGIVAKFTKRTGIKRNILEVEANKIYKFTYFEMQLALEEKMNASLNSRVQGMANLHPHSWLKESPAIGGTRCIFNTQKIVQMIMDLVQEKTKLVGRPGFWGPSLDEHHPTTSMRGGLDETFASMVMPELLEICRQAPFERLPDHRQLMTVLHLLERHLKDGDRTRPVSIALSFGLHAVLTSIFVLQGGGDLAKAAITTQVSFENLFRQLDAIADPTIPPKNAPTFYFNLQIFKQVVNFARPVPSDLGNAVQQAVDPLLSEKLAFWNPVIGGEYMLYATYVCSIGLGTATVDSMGQLRFVMHLYNALRQHDNTVHIPLLTQLDTCFDKTQAIWVCGRPTQGSFCKHFWMAWGSTASSAAKKASESFFAEGEFSSYMKKNGRETGNGVRNLDEICADEFSKSYRRIVLEDFGGDEGVAEYTVVNSSEKTTKSQQQGLIGLLTRVNMTRDAMDDDEDFVLLTNFPVVGTILLEFVNFLSEALGWDEIINEAIKTLPEFKRTGKTMGGKQMKPGTFNASDLNMRGQCLAHVWANLLLQFDDRPAASTIQNISTLMNSFFGNFAKSRYQFRVEDNDQINRIHNRVSRNPLTGCYPYGRTGKSTNDPLLGIIHFKYTKAGEPEVRLLTPGKRTPFVVGASPYDEVGSKMQKEPSGKYRHIASYSIDELIDLGWDGARYNSKGNHAAVGRYVPFIPGYDSDADDEYEPIDVVAGERAGVIGLPPEENSPYMLIPDLDGRGSRLVRINAK